MLSHDFHNPWNRKEIPVFHTARLFVYSENQGEKRTLKVDDESVMTVCKDNGPTRNIEFEHLVTKYERIYDTDVEYIEDKYDGILS